MIDKYTVVGAIKAVALAIAVLAGCKAFATLMLWTGLYSIDKGWFF